MIKSIGKDYIRKWANSPENQCIYWNECTINNDRNCYICDSRINKKDVINRKCLSKELRELIERSGGKMLFVENDSTEYSDEIISYMMEEILILHPILKDVIKIDTTRKGDALITIYQGALSKLK